MLFVSASESSECLMWDFFISLTWQLNWKVHLLKLFSLMLNRGWLTSWFLPRKCAPMCCWKCCLSCFKCMSGGCSWWSMWTNSEGLHGEAREPRGGGAVPLRPRLPVLRDQLRVLREDSDLRRRRRTRAGPRWDACSEDKASAKTSELPARACLKKKGFCCQFAESTYGRKKCFPCKAGYFSTDSNGQECKQWTKWVWMCANNWRHSRRSGIF